MLYGASEGNIKTKTPEEAKRLIENFVSSNSTKNADMHRKRLDVMDDDKFIEVKAKIGSVHKVSMVDQAEEKDVNYLSEDGFQRMESRMEQELEIKQKQIADFDLRLDFVKKLNGKLKTMATHVKMLNTQLLWMTRAVERQKNSI